MLLEWKEESPDSKICRNIFQMSMRLVLKEKSLDLMAGRNIFQMSMKLVCVGIPPDSKGGQNNPQKSTRSIEIPRDTKVDRNSFRTSTNPGSQGSFGVLVFDPISPN